jgi:hypothetical protein
VITGITGRPGTGKTLYAVALMLDAKAKGRRCVANFHSRTNSWEYMPWHEMKEVSNALVIIDEAHMWFGSRAWHKNTQDELSYFQQSRKEGLDLIWIAQHEARVDTGLREVTAYYKRCSMLFRSGLCRVRTVVPEDDKKTLEAKIFRPSKSLFRHYWSEQRILSRDAEEARFGVSEKLAGERSDAGQLRLWVGPDKKLRIPPNLWVVRFPMGQSRAVRSEVHLVAAVAESAGLYRKTWGVDHSFRDLVRAYYKDPFGVCHEIGVDNVIFPAEDPNAPPSLLYAALQDVLAPIENLDVSKQLQGAGGLMRDLLAAAGYRS